LKIDYNDTSNEVTKHNIMHEIYINRNKDEIFPKMKAFLVHKYCCVFLLPQIVAKKKVARLFFDEDIVGYISEFLSLDDIYVRERPVKVLAAQLNYSEFASDFDNKKET